MSKKVTIQDVADAAGVCKATVSYVLNNREDQKISEETKRKVWQVVNMLNYRPNAFAQNMRTASERRLIAVYLPQDLSVPEKIVCLDFLSEFSLAMHESNGSVVLVTDTAERVTAADAIVTYNITREDFFALGDRNFIPLLSVDCPIDDALFFEISSDYTALKAEADANLGGDYIYVCVPPRSQELKDAISNIFPRVLFLDRLSDLPKDAGKVFLTQPALAELFLNIPCKVYASRQALTSKIRTTLHCIKLALSHEPCDKHAYLA